MYRRNEDGLCGAGFLPRRTVRRENLSHPGKEIFFSRSVHFLPIGYLSADESQVARSLIWNKIPEMTMAIMEQYFDEVATLVTFTMLELCLIMRLIVALLHL